MKKRIDREYIRDNVAQLMLGTADNTIVMADEEILLFKLDGKVLINKYLNHSKREEFPYCDVPMHVSEGFELYNVLFEMDKNYLIYELDDMEESVIMNRFVKTSEGALWSYEKALELDEDDFEVLEYSREEMEAFFDGHNYDAAVVLDRRGEVLMAYSKGDGEVIKGNILPSREDELKVRGRSALIYGGFTMNHIMLTVKDGIFRTINFALTLDKDGSYVLDKQDIHLPDVVSDLKENLGNLEEYEKTRSVSIG